MTLVIAASPIPCRAKRGDPWRFAGGNPRSALLSAFLGLKLRTLRAGRSFVPFVIFVAKQLAR